VKSKLAGWIVAGVLLAVTGFFLLQQQAREGGDSADGRQRPAFSLPDLDGRMHTIGEWDGKVLLVNFWATWCPPCRQEIPDFIDVRKRYHDRGFEIVGVAIDDPDSVRDYVDVLEIDFPVLHGQAEASAIARQYGNHTNALPYSALIDRQGRIRFSGAGRIPRQSLEQAVKQLLAE
jgi:peroxiredoxin